MTRKEYILARRKLQREWDEISRTIHEAEDALIAKMTELSKLDDAWFREKVTDPAQRADIIHKQYE